MTESWAYFYEEQNFRAILALPRKKFSPARLWQGDVVYFEKFNSLIFG